MMKFVKKEDGLVTIEWVGVAAIMVIAGLAIMTYVMQGADGAGGRVDDALDTVPAGNFNNGADDGRTSGG